MAVSGVTGSGSGSTDYINPAQQGAANAGSQPDEQMFLQLLVAQIRSQDPMNPSDGLQFVSQLAQFSQLEQTIAIRQDADAVTKVLAPPASSSSGTSGSSGSSGTGDTSGSSGTSGTGSNGNSGSQSGN